METTIIMSSDDRAGFDIATSTVAKATDFCSFCDKNFAFSGKIFLISNIAEAGLVLCLFFSD